MKPKILISNDDGFYAPGLLEMYKAVAGLGPATIVAPASEQSGAGHAVTVSTPLKIRKRKLDGGVEGYLVNGTPADCVKIAVSVICPNKPQLVVSGINLGPNVGISLVYSGTVSAAAEGTILGIPSLAVSLDAFENPCWDTAAHVARLIANRVLRKGLPAFTMLNVNVPNLPLKKLKGIAVARMGRSRFVEIFHRRTSPRGDDYYWLDGDLELLDDAGGTDIQFLKDGFVSVTPVTFDLTNHAAMDGIKKWDLRL